MTEEPVLADTEARMCMKCFDQEGRIPKRDGAMRESSGSHLTSQCPLKTADLVFQVLRLLT